MLISRFDTANAEEKIIALEKQYGITLPEPYRTFLGRYNGGETPETSFRMASVSSDLCGFFGLGVSNAGFQMEQYFSSEEISDMTAKGKFPIGKTRLVICFSFPFKRTVPARCCFNIMAGTDGT